MIRKTTVKNTANKISSVHVVGIGENTMDTLLHIERYPSPGTKTRLLSSSSSPGGQIASALVSCSRFGLKTRYLGKFGDDLGSRQQIQSLSSENIDLHYCPIVPNCTGPTSFIIVDRDTSERTVCWVRDDRLSMKPIELDPEVICSGKILFVDGQDIEASIQAAKCARDAGLPVVADLDYVKPGTKDLLPHLTHLISSNNFPQELTGASKMVTCLLEINKKYGVPSVGVTLGQEGALFLENDKLVYSPGYRVSAVDTTGAGDSFHAAFLFGLISKLKQEEILNFANAFSALNCMAYGARGPIRTQLEINTLLKHGLRNINEKYKPYAVTPAS